MNPWKFNRCWQLRSSIISCLCSFFTLCLYLLIFSLFLPLFIACWCFYLNVIQTQISLIHIRKRNKECENIFYCILYFLLIYLSWRNFNILYFYTFLFLSAFNFPLIVSSWSLASKPVSLYISFVSIPYLSLYISMYIDLFSLPNSCVSLVTFILFFFYPLTFLPSHPLYIISSSLPFPIPSHLILLLCKFLSQKV